MTLIDNDGNPYVDGVSQGCWAMEGFFRIPELHYRQSEIRALEPFDCALTHEALGGANREEYWTRVISRKVYQRLVERDIRIECIPVHLDVD